MRFRSLLRVQIQPHWLRIGGVRAWSARLISSVLCLGFCTGSSFAGYYAVIYSNSGVSTTNYITGGVSTSVGYNQLSGASTSVAPTGSVNNAGGITATCT